MDFDPSLENTEGKRYFNDVYQPNKPEMVYSFLEDRELIEEIQNMDLTDY